MVTLEKRARFASSDPGIPQLMFLSGLQEEITNQGNTWQSKLKFWQFGLNIFQKLEQTRVASFEENTERVYEGMVLHLLAIGWALKGEIEDPEIVEQVKCSIDNLTSKYLSLKIPSEGVPNRLLNKIAA